MVKLHEYTEAEDQFVLFMEYCNDAEYFDNKIVEVSILSEPLDTPIPTLHKSHPKAFCRFQMEQNSFDFCKHLGSQITVEGVVYIFYQAVRKTKFFLLLCNRD